jgi:cytoplasmic iron level regulating protein YaaA (DUF328/UPF0246 family)
MLTVLSPAKTLDYESSLPTRKHSIPDRLDRSQELVRLMAAKSPEEIGNLMNISDDLAELNWQRFQEWEPEVTRQNSRPAVLAFKGDVYQGLEAATFSSTDFTYAQKYLRILSGLHGVLRPLDLIQPYRLEMGSQVNNPLGRNLYEFWGTDVTDSIAEELSVHRTKVLVNLASKEYFSVVDPERLEHCVVSPVFKDFNRGEYRIISFFAKRARGAMASWMIRDRVQTVKALSNFTGMGYRYSSELSDLNHPTFIREPAT